MVDKRNAYMVLVVKLKGKRSRWVDNIKMDLRETGFCGLDWIDVAQDRDQWRALMKTATNFMVT
jgi:hypothetical protein